MKKFPLMLTALLLPVAADADTYTVKATTPNRLQFTFTTTKVAGGNDVFIFVPPTGDGATITLDAGAHRVPPYGPDPVGKVTYSGGSGGSSGGGGGHNQNGPGKGWIIPPFYVDQEGVPRLYGSDSGLTLSFHNDVNGNDTNYRLNIPFITGNILFSGNDYGGYHISSAVVSIGGSVLSTNGGVAAPQEIDVPKDEKKNGE